MCTCVCEYSNHYKKDIDIDIDIEIEKKQKDGNRRIVEKVEY